MCICVCFSTKYTLRKTGRDYNCSCIFLRHIYLYIFANLTRTELRLFVLITVYLFRMLNITVVSWHVNFKVFSKSVSTYWPILMRRMETSYFRNFYQYLLIFFNRFSAFVVSLSYREIVTSNKTAWRILYS